MARVTRELPRFPNMSVPVTSAAPKTKVAAYARVSTEKEEQEDSFERQVSYYTNLIKSRLEWEFCGVYADPGISGTRAEKRADFMRMIEDCRAGKIDKILVKSISRFARNTVDALNYIRELRDLGVSVQFENENIDTMAPGGEVLLTILAAMAEQESRTISTNIKWSYQKKFQNGDVILNTGLMLGYIKTGKRDEDGHMIYEINEKEADIVRRIYREYIAGITVTQICRGLEADGIPTKLGRQKWQPSVVLSILCNEKYTGNAILGKTFKPDVLSKRRQKNTGQAPMYYTEGSHPAIIDKELWDLTRREEQRRAEVKERTVGVGRYSSKYAFSGMLICGECGHTFRRHARRVGSGKLVPAWACTLKLDRGSGLCPKSQHINEDKLEAAYLRALHRVAGNMDKYINIIKENCDMVMKPMLQKEMDEVEQQIIDVQEAVLTLHREKQRGVITPGEFAKQTDEYKAEMEALQKKQKELFSKRGNTLAVEYWLKNFSDTTTQSDEAAIEPTVIKLLVEKIIVHGKESIDIHFKCGVIITEKL